MILPCLKRNSAKLKYISSSTGLTGTVLAKKYNIEVLTEENDITLIPINKLIKQDNTAYMVYGSFYKNAIKTKVNQDIKIKYNNFIKLFTINFLHFLILFG